MGYIGRDALLAASGRLEKGEYGRYLASLLE